MRGAQRHARGADAAADVDDERAGPERAPREPVHDAAHLPLRRAAHRGAEAPQQRGLCGGLEPREVAGVGVVREVEGRAGVGGAVG